MVGRGGCGAPARVLRTIHMQGQYTCVHSCLGACSMALCFQVDMRPYLHGRSKCAFLFQNAHFSFHSIRTEVREVQCAGLHGSVQCAGLQGSVQRRPFGPVPSVLAPQLKESTHALKGQAFACHVYENWHCCASVICKVMSFGFDYTCF